MFVAVSSTEETTRLAANASHRIKRNIITAVREIREPREERVFQRV